MLNKRWLEPGRLKQSGSSSLKQLDFNSNSKKLKGRESSRRKEFEKNRI